MANADPVAPRRDITAEQAQAYVDGGAGRCPFCGGDSITGGRLDVEGTFAWQGVSCAGCGAEWQDVYRLDRVDVRRTADGREFEPDSYPATRSAPQTGSAQPSSARSD